MIDLTILDGLAVDRADIDDAAEAALQHAVPRHLGHVVAATAQIGIESTSSQAVRLIFFLVPSRVMPALLTITSTGPSSAATFSIPALQSSKDETSHLNEAMPVLSLKAFGAFVIAGLVAATL